MNRDLSLCVSLADAALIEARYLGYNPDLTEAERSEIRAEIDRLLDRAKETSFGDQRDYVETTGAEALEILRRAGS